MPCRVIKSKSGVLRSKKVSKLASNKVMLDVPAASAKAEALEICSALKSKPQTSAVGSATAVISGVRPKPQPISQLAKVSEGENAAGKPTLAWPPVPHCIA